MSYDPKNPDDLDSAQEEVESAPTVALDLSEIPLPGPGGAFGPAAATLAEEEGSTTQMSADEALAFLQSMEAAKAALPEDDDDAQRRTVVETPEHMRDVIARIQQDARAVANGGRPVAATVAESAVPLAESFSTGASPAAPPQPDVPQGPATAPNLRIEGPSTQPAAAIPKTMASAQVDAPTSAPAADDRGQALAMVQGPDTKLLMGLIIGVGVLLVVAIVVVVVLVVT